MGCDGSDLGDGTVVGGDLGPWTFADFTRSMREGKRPDGTAPRQPMANVSRYTQRMTEIELASGPPKRTFVRQDEAA